MSWYEAECPVCSEKAQKYNFEKTYGIKCPICGEFRIGSSFEIPTFTEKEKVKLKYFYYTLPKDDERRLEPITNQNKEEFLSRIIAPNSILDKMDYIMNYVAARTEFFGDGIGVNCNNGYRRFFCRDKDEFWSILVHLKSIGYIDWGIQNTDENSDVTSDSVYIIDLTGQGLEYAEKLSSNIDSKQCFVAMWFDDSTKNLYQKIKKAVTGNPKLPNHDEGYGANYNIMKIDDKHHANYIPSEIISEIKRSRFIIADLTGYRGGVYYEAGYAEGLGIPVILTCHKGWFKDIKDKKGKIEQDGVHFDLQQKNILFWTDDELDKFQRNLVARIGEVVGFNS